MDPSSLGLADQYDQFQETHEQLQTALKAIVNEHHQGFNSSIGTFHKIQTSIQSSQTRVRALRSSLVQAKISLGTTKPELKGFATASQNHDDMLQVLGMIEQLQSVPEKLEARISEKQFLSAVDILQDALRLIRRSEMDNIGALSDLRVYLSNQEHSLTDILIEELHSHLYLKSPYCENRWKAHVRGQGRDASAAPAASVGKKRTPSARSKSQSLIYSLEPSGRHLYRFLETLDNSIPMTEDASRNPEADTFHYIQLIVESLNKMSRLDVAVESIEQRLPVELFRVVDRSSIEVDQRHPSTLRGYATNRQGKLDISYDRDDPRTAILSDMLWTLYAKFEAIAEGHRVLHDVIAGIVKREGLSNALMGGFKELWKLYQSEIRSLLHDYLATDSNVGSRTGQNNDASRNMFRPSQRDKAKKLFRLSNIDNKSTELTTERENLEFILKTSVPGLVSDSRQTDGTASNDTSAVHDGSATGHKLLIEPSVFNMGILLPPSLAFLNRLKEVVPPGTDIITSTITSFLDDFLINVFHPQLDETLGDLCVQTLIELDAFQMDPHWQTLSQRPIFKGTSRFYSLITAFCKMLDTLPHDQAFSHLIVRQMTTYFEKCQGWYKALVTRGRPQAETGRHLKAAAALAEAGEISDIVTDLLQGEDVNRAQLLEKKWLAAKLVQLRHISDRTTDSSHRHDSSGRFQHKRRWTLVSSAEARTDVYLPLNQDTAVAFDSVITSYQNLATLVLRTLHLELRTHAIHRIRYSLRPSYALDQLLDTPDSGILALNADLVAFDEELALHFRPTSHRFIITGLAALADALLVDAAAHHIAALNANGAGRLQLDVLVLQQNLKNIEPGASLARAARFLDLFAEGPDAVLAAAKAAREGGGEAADKAFGYEEMRALLELCYSERLGSERRDVAGSAKKGLDELVALLGEYMGRT
ncbi:hypothetical protein LTR04_003094 [Oleoguttula sp. CCFEE 6159]|nr:hypothetical protein LTR04_003094 [Oleoguttula sp. CCFEE 6159]